MYPVIFTIRAGKKNATNAAIYPNQVVAISQTSEGADIHTVNGVFQVCEDFNVTIDKLNRAMAS